MIDQAGLEDAQQATVRSFYMSSIIPKSLKFMLIYFPIITAKMIKCYFVKKIDQTQTSAEGL